MAAAIAISNTPISGTFPVGSTVGFIGTGWVPTVLVTINVIPSSGISVYSTTVTASGAGTIAGSFTATLAMEPNSLLSGVQIYGRGGQNTASVSFQVGSATGTPTVAISNTPSSGSFLVGNTAKFSGSGWIAGNPLTVNVINTSSGLTTFTTTLTPNSSGGVSGSFTVLSNMAPTSQLSLVQLYGQHGQNVASANFNVQAARYNPVVTMGATQYDVGQTATWNSSGWPANDTISLVVNNTSSGSILLGSSLTDASGNASGQFAVSMQMLNGNTLSLTDSGGNSATSANFEVLLGLNQTLVTDKTAYNVGDIVYWKAQKFNASSQIQLSTQVGSTTFILGQPVSTDASGNASSNFQALGNLTGANTLQATQLPVGSGGSAFAYFTVQGGGIASNSLVIGGAIAAAVAGVYLLFGRRRGKKRGSS